MKRVFLKRLVYLILTAYTVIAVLGAFSLSAVEPIRAVNAGMEDHSPGAVIDSGEIIFTRNTAEEPAIASGTDNERFLFQRPGFQRIAFLFDFSSIKNSFFKSSLFANINIQYINVKNAVPLILRI